jgi:hypothetical protein
MVLRVILSHGQHSIACKGIEVLWTFLCEDLRYAPVSRRNYPALDFA